jgi:hypothetical protein
VLAEDDRLLDSETAGDLDEVAGASMARKRGWLRKLLSMSLSRNSCSVVLITDWGAKVASTVV